MIESGLLLFFLIPGLLVYCALYGTFHTGRAIAPEPPSATSIEAVTIVLLASAVVHVTSALLIHLNRALARLIGTVVTVPADVLDPYAAAFRAIDGHGVGGEGIGTLVGIALLQGAAAYGAVVAILYSLARKDRLPAWIYGWSTDIANAADNATHLIVAYVLTTHDHGDRPILYAGVLYDMALKADGCISRMTLWDCERYLADLSAGLDESTLPAPLSRVPFLLIEASQIRNVAFDILDLDEIEE